MRRVIAPAPHIASTMLYTRKHVLDESGCEIIRSKPSSGER